MNSATSDRRIRWSAVAVIVLLSFGTTLGAQSPTRPDVAPQKQMVLDYLSTPQVLEKFGKISDAIWSYADLGMHELATAAAQEALRVNPNSWMALANIGYAESMRGEYVEALEHQHEALRCHPDQEGTYKICWGLGWNYLQTDQYSKALKFTEQAISLKEAPDIILSFNKGLILLAQGKAAEAYDVYRSAMARACGSDNYR